MGFSRHTALVGFCVLGLATCVAMGQMRRATLVRAAVLHGPAGSGGNNHAQPGYLGIAFHDVNDADIAALRLKDGHGAEIIMVDHDGPAGKAGLREHDVVLTLNGTAIDGEDQLRRMLHDLSSGKTVSIGICREGAERTVTAVLAVKVDVEKQAWEQHWVVPVPVAGDVPAPDPAPQSHGLLGRGFIAGHLLPSPTYTGATVDAMGAQLAEFFGVKDGKGLLVHQVDGNSPAATAGLRAGDVITRMNGTRVGTEKDWTRALHDSKGHPVSMTVIRDRREQFLTMIPEGHHRSSAELPPPPTTGAQDMMLMR